MIKVEDLSTEWTRFRDVAGAELRAASAIMQLPDSDQSDFDRATAALRAFIYDPRVQHGYMINGVVYETADAIPREITCGFVTRPTGLDDVYTVVRRRTRPCARCKGEGRHWIYWWAPCDRCDRTGREVYP